MGATRMGPPPDLIEALKKQFAPGVFIETGTYRGATARWASSHFQTVYTIEASREAYDSARGIHQTLANVTFLFGSSPEVLRQLLPTIHAPALFWLDAHWMGSESFGETKECPLLDELKEINRSPNAHFILVDDARLFLAPPPLPHKAEQWPDIRAVLDELSQKPRYTTVFEDVIVSVPETARGSISAFLQQRTTAYWHAGAKSGVLQRLRSLLGG
jgi:hypothetical protein